MKSKLFSQENKIKWKNKLALELLSHELKNAKSRQRARLKRTTNNTQSLEISDSIYLIKRDLICLKKSIKLLEKLEAKEQEQRKKLNNQGGRNFLGETYGDV